MSVSVRIGQLLKNVHHHDKDERFMATSDLATALEQIDGQLDNALQLPVSRAILTQLEDASSDVQTMAVKCLSSLLKKVSAEQMGDIVEKLSTLLIDHSKSESRDIYSIGLKTITNELPSDHAATESLTVKIVHLLTNGLNQCSKLKNDATNNDVESACIEVLREVLLRFGHRCSSSLLNDLLSVTTSRLTSKTDTIRKKAIQLIGVMVPHLSDDSYSSLMTFVLNGMERAEQNKEAALLYTYLQTIGIIAQSAGTRVSHYLQKIVQQLQKYCSLTSDASFARHGGDDHENALSDLRENCLSAFESIVLRCPKEVSPFISSFISISLSFLSYDPNYSYEAENNAVLTDGSSVADEGGEGGDSNWGDGDDSGWGGDDEIGDDDEDDGSWKVRRAAVRVLSSFIRVKDTLPQIYPSTNHTYFETLFGALIDRLKERDVNVKIAVIRCIAELLKESVIAKKDFVMADEKSYIIDANSSILPAASSNQILASLSVPQLVRARSMHNALTEKLKIFVDQIVRQFSAGSKEVKQALMAMIRELLIARQQLDDYLSILFPPLLQTATNDDGRLKSDAVSLLRLFAELHSATLLSPHIASLADVALAAVDDSYLKLKAEGLKLISSIAHQLPEWRSTNNPSLSSLVQRLYQSVYATLLLKEVDVDTKESSLQALSFLLAYHGDILASTLSICLPVVAQRLHNELTRRSALRAITFIANSSLHLDLSPLLSIPSTSSSPSSNLIDEISRYLKKENSTLRHESVIALTALARCSSHSKPLLDENARSQLIKESAALLTNDDRHLSHLVLQLIISILRIHQIAPNDAELLLNRVFLFLKSPLQGEALQSIVAFFQQFVQTSSPLLNYSAMVLRLIENLDNDAAYECSMAVAHCIAGMTKIASSAEKNETIQKLLAAIDSSLSSYPSSKVTPATLCHVSMLTLGELGRDHDLSLFGAVHQSIYRSFSNESASIRQAAAYAFGNISIGNLAKFLPSLADFLSKSDDGRIRYLLLSALREVIIRHSHTEEGREKFAPFVSIIVPLLFSSSIIESADESVRSMVAECVGNLAIIDPNDVLKKMQSLIQANNPHTRAVIITALRYSVSSHSNDILKHYLPSFLVLLNDQDIAVHRQALLTLNALANTHFDLLLQVVRDDSREIKSTPSSTSPPNDPMLRLIHRFLQPNPSLVRVINMGPFTHRVDDGLPLRKAAFQCVETFLNVAAHRIDLSELIRLVYHGLSDDSTDIQILCYQIMDKFARWHGVSMMESLDSLPNLIMKGVREKLKEAKSEDDSIASRAIDVLRAAVRCMAAIQKIPGVEACQAWSEFYQRVLKTQLLLKMVQEMQLE